MIKIFRICEDTNALLFKAINDNVISDFRIVLRFNEIVQVYAITDSMSDAVYSLENRLQECYKYINVDFFLSSEKESLPLVFNTESKSRIIIENGRRRLNSFAANKSESKKSGAPVVTFYSFKGGQGRSTTLAALASYLAIKHSQKVFIIDCDIEAPGFNNFFSQANNGNNSREGFIEYLLDKASGLTTPNQLIKYVMQADAMYSGNGSINVMSAGNLDIETNTDDFLHKNLFHYLEGLARIDMNNNNYAIEILKSLINDINEQYRPDVILIDSRTGFNDIMGLFANSLSQIVVGFFRGDTQSLPGLQHFVSTLAPRRDVETFIVNSILPSPGRLNKSLFNSFKENLETIKDNVLKEYESENGSCASDFELSDLMDKIKAFPLSRRDELELVGSPEEDPEDFISLSCGTEYSDYERLFSTIFAVIEDNSSSEDTTEDFCSSHRPVAEEVAEKTPKKKKSNALNVIVLEPRRSIFDIVNKATPKQKHDSLIQWREDILTSAKTTLDKIDLYADNINIEEQYENGGFFLRECMKELFNLDKYVILGSKGTGKSYLYNALRSKQLVKVIKEYARKDDDFIFINTIDKTNWFFKVEKFGEREPIFRQNFWLVFTWLTIAKTLKRFAPEFKFNENIEIIDLRDDNATLEYLTRVIDNKESILEIEAEYRRLDDFLLSREGDKLFLTILYDQLDYMVQPENWSLWIPSLMELWRFKRFNRIFGKLFLRKDLFKKMKGITNKKDVEYQAIDIEWKRDEVYSFFFKTILTDEIIARFWGVCYIREPQEQRRIIKQKEHYETEENRFKLDSYYLRPLVDAFFGTFVKTRNIRNLGETYFWLYDNLKNADDTISLRPFIDHIKASIDLWQSSGKRNFVNNINNFAILPPDYYTDKKVRESSVKRHIEDFVEETGNKPIDVVFDFFKNAHAAYKYIKLQKPTFENALELILQTDNYAEQLSGQNKQTLIDLLITNGIISKETNRTGDYYRFAHLYKYYLGLKGGMAPNNTSRPFRK